MDKIFCRYNDACNNKATTITKDTLCPMCDGCKAIAQDANNDHDDPRYIPIREYSGQIRYLMNIQDGKLVNNNKRVTSYDRHKR
jgi:hypothetical protein